MDGRAFLEAAQDLVGYGKESHWRTAAGCAYYALMLEARDALQRWGFSVPPHGTVHSYVRLRFTYVANPDLKQIGDALDYLVQLRNQAHYQLRTAGWFVTNTRVVQGIAIARDAIFQLDRIDHDPTEQAAAVTVQPLGSS